MTRGSVIVVALVLATVPLVSGGSGGREVEITYVTAQYAGVYLGGDEDASVSVGTPGQATFHFQPGESRATVVVRDVTALPMGGSWVLRDHSHEGPASITGYFCETFEVTLPEPPGEHGWHLGVQVWGFPGSNPCSFVPPPSTAGTITATFT